MGMVNGPAVREPLVPDCMKRAHREQPSVHPSTARAVCLRLQAAYGSPRLGNPRAPLDDLVFIIASNRTGAAAAQQVYKALRQRFPQWEGLATVSGVKLAKILAPVGLANKRARHLIGIAKRLKTDFGHVTLKPLAPLPDIQIENYLISLPGVSEKVAKCVLLYGFDRPVLPVDVHVHRVTRRLGWHNHSRADQSHDTLESIVPKALRYGFHTNAIAHGRAI